MADKERETEAREERNLGGEREKERASPLGGNKIEVRGLRVMMTNVRASNLHPTLQEDILRSWPLLLIRTLLSLSLSLSLSPCSLLHPRFSSSCRVSCLSRPPLEPPAHRYPRCLQREQPSSRRFGKLPLFLSRWNISAASREEDASRRTKRNGQTRNGSSARRTLPLGILRL